MSKKEANVGAKTAEGGLAGVFLDTNWEERLKEARAKRKQALSGKTSNADRGKNRRSASTQTTVKTTGSDRAEIGVRLNGRDAKKAMFVFAGAFGFGLGAVLGIGVLIGWAQQEDIPRTQIAAHHIIPPMSRSVVPTSPDVPGNVPIGFASFAPPEMSLPQVALIATPRVPETSDETHLLRGHAGPDAVLMRSLPEARKVTDAFSLAEPVVTKVFIHAPTSVGQTRLAKWSAQIEASGIDVAGIGRESFQVSTTHLRYYSPDTKDDAIELAADLGLQARDFSENALVPGRIEIWVAGEARKRVSRQRQSQPEQGSFSWLHNKQNER